MNTFKILPLLLCGALVACDVSDVYEHDAADFVAPYDPVCDSLEAHPLDVEAVLSSAGEWNKPIPRLIHQIWLGPPEKFQNEYAEKVVAWQAYAQALGYEHRVWIESDLATLMHDMDPANVAVFEDVLDRRNYHAASDVLRYEIVRQFGGMYVDCDITPPSHRGAFVDFESFVPMRGLVLAPEPQGRNIGSGDGIFIMNGWFMASARHPIMQHLTASLRPNFEKWDREQDRLIAAYATGPFLLNRTLAGSFTVLPISFLKKLGMVDFW